MTLRLRTDYSYRLHIITVQITVKITYVRVVNCRGKIFPSTFRPNFGRLKISCSEVDLIDNDLQKGNGSSFENIKKLGPGKSASFFSYLFQNLYFIRKLDNFSILKTSVFT